MRAQTPLTGSADQPTLATLKANILANDRSVQVCYDSSGVPSTSPLSLKPRPGIARPALPPRLDAQSLNKATIKIVGQEQQMARVNQHLNRMTRQVQGAFSPGGRRNRSATASTNVRKKLAKDKLHELVLAARRRVERLPGRSLPRERWWSA